MNNSQNKPPISWGLITVFIIVSAILYTFGTLFVNSQKGNLRKEKESELLTIANLKVDQISQWRYEKLGDANLIQDNLSLVGQIHEFLHNPANSRGRKNLTKWMGSILKNYGYLNINVLDPRGKVWLSLPAGDSVIGPVLKPLIPLVITNQKILFTDLHRASQTDIIHIDVLIPMVSHNEVDSTLEGLVILRIDPSKVLYPLVLTLPAPSRTSETLIIRREGDSVVYLNALKHYPNSALTLRKSIYIERFIAAKAVTGSEGILEGVDYRNVEVIAALKKIPDSPWYLVSKIDKEEMDSTFAKQLLLAKLLILVFISAFGAVIGWMIWNQRVRYYRQRYEAELDRLAVTKHFNYILKYANDIILLLDKDLNIIDANDHAFEVYGYSKDELIGMNIMSLRLPELDHQLEEQIKILNETSFSRYETIHKCRDSKTFPIEISARLVEIEGKKYYQSIGRDITERRKIEDNLKVLLERFNLATRAAKLSVWDWNIIDDQLLWDDRLYDLYGVKKGELLPVYSNWLRIVHPDDMEKANRDIEMALSGQTEYDTEFRIVHPDGSVKYIKAYGQVVNDTAGKPKRMIGINYDITEQKNAEIRIEESNSLLRATLESTADGILVVDLNGNIVQFNKKFTEMWGIPDTIISSRADEKALSFVRDQLKEPDSFINNVRHLYDNPDSVSYDNLEFSDGRIFERYSQPQKINDEIVGRVWSFRDITQRKIVEDQLISAKEKAVESDRLKTAFLHNISHEIRTPMNAIVGFTALLDDPELQPETRKQYIDIIYQSSNQLLSIITDIVDISNIETGQTKVNRKDVNINYLIHNLYEQFSIRAAQQNLALNYKLFLSDEEAYFETDGTKVVQILSNLLNNSLKFTKQGKIELGYELKGDSVEFKVSDTGIGISKDKQTRIFDRFYQVENSTIRQYGGTGLGLSICRAYAELLGGSIRVHSEPFEGSEFYLTLPFKSSKKEIMEKADNPENVNGSFEGKTILVAEDDDINYLVVKKSLAATNFDLIRAKNGREAVDICRSNKNIDIVLLDLKMPVMDGFEAMRLIKAFRPELPFIAITAYAFDSDKKNAFDQGCSDYISKPFSKNNLLEVLKRHI